MTEFFLQHHRFSFTFPAASEPSWSQKVERWYQLDAAAYGLVQGFSELRESLGSRPDMIVLASPRASNSTDRSFAVTGASSPSKFVHTLPNVRGAPLLQVMGWGGPVICVQDDPQTILNGIDQALGFLETDSRLHRIWVLSVQEDSSGALNADYFVLSRETGPIRICPLKPGPEAKNPAGQTNDSLWLDWVCRRAPGSFSLSSYHKATI
jgi:hypothetical protein